MGFDGDESESILKYLGFSITNPTIQISDPQNLITAFNDMINSWKSNDKDIYALFAAFYNCIQTIKNVKIFKTPQILLQNDNNILLRAQSFIHSNLHENIKVKDVVKHLNIDRSYFTKIFKQKFNLTPYNYILQCRLQEAESLLSITNFTIKEIVNVLNFNDVYSFSRLFKKRFNCSPTKYRKTIKNNSI